jgi:hypothetical protein
LESSNNLTAGEDVMGDFKKGEREGEALRAFIVHSWIADSFMR